MKLLILGFIFKVFGVGVIWLNMKWFKGFCSELGLDLMLERVVVVLDESVDVVGDVDVVEVVVLNLFFCRRL